MYTQTHQEKHVIDFNQQPVSIRAVLCSHNVRTWSIIAPKPRHYSHFRGRDWLWGLLVLLLLNC